MQPYAVIKILRLCIDGEPPLEKEARQLILMKRRGLLDDKLYPTSKGLECLEEYNSMIPYFQESAIDILSRLISRDQMTLGRYKMCGHIWHYIKEQGWVVPDVEFTEDGYYSLNISIVTTAGKAFHAFHTKEHANA